MYKRIISCLSDKPIKKKHQFLFRVYTTDGDFYEYPGTEKDFPVWKQYAEDLVISEHSPTCASSAELTS